MSAEVIDGPGARRAIADDTRGTREGRAPGKPGRGEGQIGERAQQADREREASFGQDTAGLPAERGYVERGLFRAQPHVSSDR